MGSPGSCNALLILWVLSAPHNCYLCSSLWSHQQCTPRAMLPEEEPKPSLRLPPRGEAHSPCLPCMAWPLDHSMAPLPLCTVPHQPQVCFRPQQVVCKQFSAGGIKQPCKRCCYLVGKGRRKSKQPFFFPQEVHQEGFLAFYL